MSRKQHTESRSRPYFTLCGREMPQDQDPWSPDAESCEACARVVRLADARRNQRAPRTFGGDR
jgi:hypothetical protein